MVIWEHVVGDPTMFLAPVYVDVPSDVADIVVGDNDLVGAINNKSELLFG